MTLQTVISRYLESKAAVGFIRGANPYKKEGRGKTLEDAHIFICDCEIALKQMGKWGKVLLEKYSDIYLWGFKTPMNKEHKILDQLAYTAFKNRGLLDREYYQ